METLPPLAKALQLPIDNTYPNEDYAGLARLAQALGVKDAPAHWADERFDRVWRMLPGDLV